MRGLMRAVRDLFHALDNVPVWPPRAFARHLRREMAKMNRRGDN